MTDPQPGIHPDLLEWMSGTESLGVLRLVFEERIRQVTRYGLNHDLLDGTWLDAQVLPSSPFGGSMTAEEFEDICRADYEEHQSRHGLPTWMHLVREEVAEAFKESDPVRLAEELVQVAALCVSWVETLAWRSAQWPDVGHNWVSDADEGMVVCSDCDTYRGSRASSKPCRARLV